MEIISGYLVMTILGLVAGSFSGATVWRLRARQLIDDKKAGEKVDTDEFNKLKKLSEHTISNDRSMCLHCKHELRWYDLIPLVSWLSTKGKCRYCKKTIGYFEPLMEIGTAAAFVLFYGVWVSANGVLGNIPILGLWVVILTLLAILFAYDAKWFILPDVIIFPLIAASIVVAGVGFFESEAKGAYLLSTFGRVVILSGLYLALWIVSKGNWVGFGDVKLGLALGLLLADWKLAFLALFLANLFGTLLVLPGLLRKQLTRQTQVPFGPLLIAGFFVALLYGNSMILAYEQMTLSLFSI